MSPALESKQAKYAECKNTKLCFVSAPSSPWQTEATHSLLKTKTWLLAPSFAPYSLGGRKETPFHKNTQNCVKNSCCSCVCFNDHATNWMELNCHYLCHIFSPEDRQSQISPSSKTLVQSSKWWFEVKLHLLCLWATKQDNNSTITANICWLLWLQI